MSLILDALRKAQEERKKLLIRGVEKKTISLGKPRKLFYFILAGALCVALLIVFIPFPKKTKPPQPVQVSVKKEQPVPPKVIEETPVAPKPKQEMPVRVSQEGRIKRSEAPKETIEPPKTPRIQEAQRTRQKRDYPSGKRLEEDISPPKEDPRMVIKKLDEEKIANMYNEAVIESNRGNIEAAKRLYLQILAEKPEHIEVLNNLGVIAMREGNTKDALNYYRRILEKVPNYAKAYNNMAIVLMREGNKRLAEEYFKKAIDIDKDSLEAYVNLSALLRSERRLSEAAKTLESLLKKGNKEPSLFLSYALIKDEMGEAKDAILYYRYYLRSAGKSEERAKVIERLKLLEDRQFTKNP